MSSIRRHTVLLLAFLLLLVWGRVIWLLAAPLRGDLQAAGTPPGAGPTGRPAPIRFAAPPMPTPAVPLRDPFAPALPSTAPAVQDVEERVARIPPLTPLPVRLIGIVDDTAILEAAGTPSLFATTGMDVLDMRLIEVGDNYIRLLYGGQIHDLTLTPP